MPLYVDHTYESFIARPRVTKVDYKLIECHNHFELIVQLLFVQREHRFAIKLHDHVHREDLFLHSTFSIC